MMDDPEYVYICICPGEKKMAVCPCDELTKDSISVYSSRGDGEIYSMPLIHELKKLRPALMTDRSYRLDGTVNDSGVAEFCINDATELEKNPKERCEYEYKQ